MDWNVFQRWTLAVLCILFTGCTVCENARRTVCTEPAAFYWKKDKRRSMALYSRWADEAWQGELQHCPDLIQRPDYGMGFRDGFVDFVWGGGTGEPPLVPPRKLWNVAFRSEDGHRRSMEWFDGYRHGARVARDGGYRSLATLRSSLFGMPRDGTDYLPPGMSPEGGVEAGGEWPHSESLPAPNSKSQPAPRAGAADEKTREPAGPPDATEPEETAPVRKPKLPPVPRNLPPTIPRNLELPEFDEPPTQREAPAGRPAASPAAEPVPADVEPVPLSIPPSGPESGPPGDAPAGQSPVTQPKTTSVRIIGVPAIASRPARSFPAASPPPAVGPAPRVGNTSAQFPIQSTGIRLTVATSEAEPAATAERPASSIKLHQGWNVLRGPQSLQPTPGTSRLEK